MYVMLKDGLCERSDEGVENYEVEFSRFFSNNQLDFVVFGLGFDGYIVFLFFYELVLNEKEKFVILFESG